MLLWKRRLFPSCRGGSRGAIASLKSTTVTLFTMIFYNSENSIRDIRPLYRPLFCHRSVVKYTLSFLQYRSHYYTWLPNIAEIVPPKLVRWIRPCLVVPLLKGQGVMPPLSGFLAYRYQQSLSQSITCQDVCAQQSHAGAEKCLISSLEVNIRRFVAMLLLHNKD